MALKLFHRDNAISLLVPTTTLFFLPNNYDSFNLPKLLALVLIVNFLYLTNLKFLTIKLSNRTKWIFGISCAVIVMGAARSSDISSAILGNYAQNTGLLALITCLLLAIFLLKYNYQNLSKSLLGSLVLTGVLASLYAIIQRIGLDPVAWKEQGWIVSTLGNPNFSSSYLGIISLISAILFFSEKKAKIKISYGICAMLNLIGCYLSQSDQGFAILAVGSLFLMLNFVLRNTNLVYKIFINSVMGIFALTIIIFLLKRKDELAFIRNSLEYRLYYWQASLEIIRNNLFLGIGYGDFEDEFFRYRSVNHFLYGRGEFAASAHNYFLDFYSLGGLPLGTGYLMFCILITYLLFSITKRDWKENTQETKILFIGWIGFILQSLVSIPVISFLIFGTIIASLITKSYLRSNIAQSTEFSFKSKRIDLSMIQLKSASSAIVLILNFALSGVIANGDNKLKGVLDFAPANQLELEQKMNEINDILTLPIYREEYKFMLAKNLFNQGLGYQAKPIMEEATNNALHASRKFWYLAYFSMNIGNNQDSLKYFIQAKRLDPMNLDLRKDLVLLLKKQKNFKAANIELEELRKIAPLSEQVKTLNGSS